MNTTMLLLCVLAASTPGDTFGSALAVIGDVDGDSIADWAASDPWGPGVVELRSGRTGRSLWALSSPSQEIGWGKSLAPVGDWNSDGTPDLAVACSPSPDDAAHVVVVSGKDGARLFEVPRSVPSGWIGAVAGGSDFDRDGTPDLVLVQTVYRGPGTPSTFEAWSGRSRERTWATAGVDYSGAGAELATGVDLTADGIPDVLGIVRRERKQEIVLLSGKDGMCAWACRSMDRAFVGVDFLPRPKGSLVIAARTGLHESKQVGRLSAYEIGRNEPVWTIDLPHVVADMDVELCARHDLDGDGVADVVVGQRMANLFSGRIDAYSGEKGEKLWELENSTGEDFGYAVCAHPDLDGDGVGDYLVAAVCPYNSERPGAVVAVTGRTGRELYRVGRTTPRESSGR